MGMVPRLVKRRIKSGILKPQASARNTPEFLISPKAKSRSSYAFRLAHGWSNEGYAANLNILEEVQSFQLQVKTDSGLRKWGYNDSSWSPVRVPRDRSVVA